jgi:TnpA family transposase
MAITQLPDLGLLGYQFSPRLADIGGTRFWRVDKKADYGVLNALAAQRINTMLITEHWEDLLRLEGSLRLGTVQASGLIRTLQTKDRPTRLARALEEVGRLVKTLYLLRYIEDEAYRRRILVQLNRGEGRHQLARVVFHGKRGELRQRLSRRPGRPTRRPRSGGQRHRALEHDLCGRGVGSASRWRARHS